MHAHLLKVGHFTMDNVSNNRTMMEQLEPMLASHDIPFDATDCQIMCFAHMISLCSGHVIHAMTDGAVDNDAYSLSSDDDDNAHSSSSDDTHLAPNPIQAACTVVRAI